MGFFDNLFKGKEPQEKALAVVFERSKTYEGISVSIAEKD